MLSSTNTIVGASLGLGCHDVPIAMALGLFVGGWWGCAFLGLSMLAHDFGGRCGELFGDICFCCSLASGLFGCGGGCFRFLEHLEIEGAHLKQSC